MCPSRGRVRPGGLALTRPVETEREVPERAGEQRGLVYIQVL